MCCLPQVLFSKAMLLAVGLVQDIVVFDASLVQESYVSGHMSCSGKLCCLLQVFRKNYSVCRRSC